MASRASILLKRRDAARVEHIDACPHANGFAQCIGERLLAGGLHVPGGTTLGFDDSGGCKVRSQKEEVRMSFS